MKYLTNATIRHLEGTNDPLLVSLGYFKQKTFLELSKDFALSYESYPTNKTSLLKMLTANQYKLKTLDNFWGEDHITTTTNKDNSTNITVSSSMITLILFLKDEDAMMVYAEYLDKMGDTVIELIKLLGIKQQYPEAFI